MNKKVKIILDVDNQTPLDFILKYDNKNGVTLYQKNGKTVIEHIDNWVKFCGIPSYTGNEDHGTSHWDSWLYHYLISVYECSPERSKEICEDALKQIYGARKIKFNASNS